MDIRDQLYDHVPRLRRYARALTGNPELADDLVQDTLERALSRHTMFEAGTDARAWLFTIMHNLFLNQQRRAPAQAAHVSLDETDIAEREVAVPVDPARRLEIRDLDEALRHLPAEQRAIVLLVGLEDMSYADVAASLQVPIGTVMSRLSRGRQRLRDLMSGISPSGGIQQPAKLKVVR
ncbi:MULTISPECIES: sigma-70 family RNA polymerase sigma factor [Pandoraea]|uniref:RNA polymerase sigma factor n=1 Tax=Pandoraea TaxID=93217 RepID=UPI001F5C5832|nr:MULTISPECIES: sigma-70 family RNA polymerase sigma factor [Pandoraea]MCI3206698.1 RNA polymerase subunit sigma-24 [Pandoraea sp. LA3]MDN4584726.1 RNA polymerase subunit sigma-24 [Pandoraea capi]